VTNQIRDHHDHVSVVDEIPETEKVPHAGVFNFISLKAQTLELNDFSGQKYGEVRSDHPSIVKLRVHRENKHTKEVGDLNGEKDVHKPLHGAEFEVKVLFEEVVFVDFLVFFTSFSNLVHEFPRSVRSR
jgi:hypothetical protein